MSKVIVVVGPDNDTRYTKLFWINNGPYNNLTARKFVLTCTPEAFQAAAQAAAKAGTTDGKKVAAAIKGGKWDTVLGPITYDKKGDITVVDYVVYQWDKGGNYAELPAKSGS